MTTHALRSAWLGLVMILVCATAHADSPFAHAPGISLDAGGALAINNDDRATDFDGNHPVASLQLGYRVRIGTEAFATAGLGLGGRSAIFATWGGGVRQRIRLGRLQPFVDLGVYDVAEDARLAPALGIGAGLDVEITDQLYAGASAGHYFSDDSDEIGGLDWSARAYIGTRLGAPSHAD